MSSEQRFAVIGMGCRFPGSSNSPKEFYDNLYNGRDCVVEIPSDRWNRDHYYSEDRDEPGKMYVRRAGFMDHIYDFDYHAFKMSRKEASNIDPQQKILLEVAYQALEDSNIDYKGSRTAVFVGSGQVDYASVSVSEPHIVNQYTATGTSLAIHSNLISYKFDLRGPSMIVDTACSSSGTAMYLALNALKQGDCDQALVGGINILLNQNMTIAFSKLGVLSPDGKCKSFDESADGYVRSEGAGFVVVKPLDKAIADGDHIYCELVSCVANEDGAQSPSLTMPSAEAQEVAMRKALALAGAVPDDVYYVEAHATGTVVGDSTEVNTIGRVFGEGRTNGTPLRIGSVKSTIGHCEYSSFMASLIKCCLMIQTRTLLPSIHFKNPNPKIEFDRYHMRVQTEAIPVEESIEGKFFTITSFGFGGANVCCLLRVPTAQESTPQASKSAIPYPEQQLFVVKGQSKEAVLERIEQYNTYSSATGCDPKQLAYTLGSVKSAFRFVSFGTGRKFEEVSFCEPIRASESDRRPLCLVFSGQGPQHVQMCRELYRTVPFVRDFINLLDEKYKNITGISVLHDWNMFHESGTCADDFVQRIEVTLPTLLFAHLSLYELWKKMGLKPDIVIGHSFGELTSIYASGAISLDDVIALTAARASLMLKLDNQGTMCALGCGSDVVNELIASNGLKQCWIAAYNSPTSVTVGGVVEEIDVLVAEASKLKIFARKLSVSNAYHTPLLQPLRNVAYDEFAKCVVTQLDAPKEKIVSSVTGQLYVDKFTPEYFWSNIENAVLFHQGISTVRAQFTQDPIFLEISPHPVLAISMKQIGCETVLPSIIRNKPELPSIYDTASKLIAEGFDLDFSIFSGPHSRLRDLPTYPFQRGRCFNESLFHQDERLVSERENISPLLGRRMHTIDETWMNQMNAKTLDWVKDHVVQNNIIFPGAGYIEIALQALQTHSLSSFVIHKALLVKEDEFRIVQTRVKDNRVQIFSSDNGREWTCHAEAEGQSSTPASIDSKDVESIQEVQNRCQKKVDHLYGRFALLDLNYGPHFQLLDQVFEGNDEAFGILNTSALTQFSRYIMHPSIIDNCFQCFLCCKQNLSRTYLPTKIKTMKIHKSLQEGESSVPTYVHCKLTFVDEVSLIGDAVAYNKAGEPVFSIVGFECKAMPKGEMEEKKLYTIQWQKKALQLLSLEFPKVESEEQITLMQKKIAYYVKNCSTDSVHPSKEAWWSRIQELAASIEPLDEIVEVGDAIESMGKGLASFLSNDQPSLGVQYEKNALLQDTVASIANYLPTLTQTIQSEKQAALRVQAQPDWLMKDLKSLVTCPYIDLVENVNDTHCDVLVSFATAEETQLKSVVPNHLSLVITPTRNIIHNFICPEDLARSETANDDASNAGQAYIVKVNQLPGAVVVPRNYDQVIVYNEPSCLPLLERVQSISPDQNVLLVILTHITETPETSALVGFGRVIANEFKNWDVKMIDCSSSDSDMLADQIKSNPDHFEQEMRLIGGDIHVPRLIQLMLKDSDKEVNPSCGYHLHVSQPGLLSSLQWYALSSSRVEEKPVEPHQVLVKVVASSLNFKDMMQAQGMLKGLDASIKLGLEFSGVILKVGSNVSGYRVGDEVFGFGDQCLASHVVTSEHLIAPKPKNLSHREACSIPAVFVTSYFGLIYKAQLSEGQSVLIHSAAGGVGQAAIQIAKWKKASQILLTVGSQSKREYLTKNYGVSLFANSHTNEWSSEFEQQGVAQVDTVLNSLSGPHIEMGIKMLKPYGSFVEIGKRDILSNNPIHLRPFLENLSFHSVHLDRMISGREDLVGRLLKEISKLFEEGHFKANVDRTFAPKDIEAAFRYMQSGQHMGKIIIDMEEVPSNIQPVLDILSPHKTYILSGGLGAVGFEIAKWMVKNGAGEVLLLSRTGIPSKQQKYHIDASMGKIRSVKADVNNADDIRNLYTNHVRGPIGGIVHLAMYLDDDRISKLTADRFEKVLQPKIDGAKNLIGNCPQVNNVDFVVFFSSISSIIGNPEQANYAAGNCFLDTYAFLLREKGINASVINLGTVEDVGVIAQDYTLRRLLISRGLLKEATSVKEICNSFMPHLIRGTTTQLVPEIDLKDICDTHPSLRPVFGPLTNKSEEDGAGGDAAGANELTEEIFRQTIGQLLQMKPEDIDMGEKLTNYGVDSLLAVEISTIFSKKYQKQVTQMDILGGMTGNQVMQK